MARKKKATSVKKKKSVRRKSGRPALVTPATAKSASEKQTTTTKISASKKTAGSKKRAASKKSSARKKARKKVLLKKAARKKVVKKKASRKKTSQRKTEHKKTEHKKKDEKKASTSKPAGNKASSKKSIRSQKTAPDKATHTRSTEREQVKRSAASRNKSAPRKYAFEIASREQLIEALVNAGKPLNHEQVADQLKMFERDDKYEALGRRLGAMVRDGQIVRNRRGGFLPVDEDNLMRGRVSAHPDGFGFLINETGGEDIFLAARQMRSVMDGDRVVVQITGSDRKGRQEGAVIEVLERAVKTLVGRLQISRGVAVLQPDNKRIAREIVINDTAKAKDGQIVLAEIVEQPTNSRPAIASVVEVLGEHLSPGMEIDIAIRARDIPTEWPDEVVSESGAFGSEVNPSAVKDRRDIRSMPLVTIDGEDARDFDDAVYAEEKDNGFRLVVAIADVSHYVTVGSALDGEAYNRGTSVYFPQRVVPMLPESLSNGLCSLNPDVDRLCMVCDMSIDSDGQIKRTRFYPATMRSHARLTYTEVHHYLTSANNHKAQVKEKSALGKAQQAAVEKIGVLGQHIDVLHKLYGVMREARSERGAIEFESKETRIVFNNQKKIDQILPVQRNEAHMLIEECMIAANISAARYIEKRKIPGLYRSHEGPGADKLLELRKFLSLRGLQLGGGDHPGAIDYAKTLASADGRPDKLVVQTVMLRSMNQAVYSTRNAGHFGLALEEYAHFTSPIRRYPDLMVHRAIKHMLVHNDRSNFEYSQNHMAEIGDHCSTTERRAEEASRDVVAWLKCEFMQDHIGGTYEGVITGVTSFGLFVELAGIHVEGLVHITSLPQDYYDFDSVNHRLLGRKGGLAYNLGQIISVVVGAVNLDERKIDFQIDKSKIGFSGGHKSGHASGKGQRKSRNSGQSHGQGHSQSHGQGSNKRRKPKSEKQSMKRKRKAAAKKKARRKKKKSRKGKNP